jgi:hypothetical protein
MLKWIEERKPLLVGKAEEYIATTRPHENNVTASQFRNLLAAAQAGQSVPLLVNLLRYQMGRRSNAWQHRESGEALSELLRSAVESALAERFREHIGTLPMHSAQARASALLLGYIVREFTYRDKLRAPRRG